MSTNVEFFNFFFTHNTEMERDGGEGKKNIGLRNVHVQPIFLHDSTYIQELVLQIRTDPPGQTRMSLKTCEFQKR